MFSLNMSIFRFGWLLDYSCLICQQCLDNKHCLSDAIAKQNKMERMYLLVQIRCKFCNKNGFKHFSKGP